MENQEINAKEAQVTTKTLNNSWIPRSYAIAESAQAQPASITDDDNTLQETSKKRSKSWIPWPVF